jgi:hypothetical protein
LDRAAQTARKLSRTTRRYAAARGLTPARRIVATGLSFAEVGLHQCLSEKQSQTKSGRRQLVPFSRPKPGPDGASAATLTDSVRETPLRQTQRWREPDSNLRYRGRRRACGRSLRAQRVETDPAKGSSDQTVAWPNPAALHSDPVTRPRSPRPALVATPGANG